VAELKEREIMTVQDVARICHEANRIYCQTLGDTSQLPWEEAPEWQRTSALNGVRDRFLNPSAPASRSHNTWVAEKLLAGWKYGPVKDADKKEHPCLVPFEHLPLEQQVKDRLFVSVVDALEPLVVVITD